MIKPGGGRETWAEVDLDALRHNFRQVRGRVGRTIRILAVVKANAYGHGAVPCSQVLARAGADLLGVATSEEGLELRRAGLRTPIVVLGLTRPSEAAAMVRADLQATVCSDEHIRYLSRAAKAAGRRARVHVKVDTGMGRIGLPSSEMPAAIERWRRWTNLDVDGVFTHFAHADGRDPILLNRQWHQLQAAALVVRRHWPQALVHAANSAAILEAPHTWGDLVRPGLMLYGLYPAARLARRAVLRPVLSWHTRIIQLKSVPAGTGLSYGHTYVTPKPARIATLPVGYADGYSRAFSNRGSVLVHGKSCPVVGRVCMDMCLADVTAVPGAKLDDPVVLLGCQGSRQRSADRLAAELGTISYEITCAIGARVTRRYRGGRT